MNLLQGKVAIITGGSRGIGAQIVKTFVAQGCQVAFTYLSSSKASENLIQSLPKDIKVKAYQSDASKLQDAEALVNEVVKDFGKVDILINNAGITRDNLMLRMSEEAWDEVMNTNLKSVFNLTKPVIKQMLRTGGSIINMGSVVGVFGNAGQANYAAAKAGIIGFSKSIAKELGSRNIRCNVIAPGFIETDMTHTLESQSKGNWADSIPLKKMGQPEDVANSCLFLASNLGSYITGQVISVCGGLNI